MKNLVDQNFQAKYSMIIYPFWWRERKCLSRSPFWRNVFVQTPQAYGFSPLCMRSWFFNASERWKRFSPDWLEQIHYLVSCSRKIIFFLGVNNECKIYMYDIHIDVHYDGSNDVDSIQNQWEMFYYNPNTYMVAHQYDIFEYDHLNQVE